MLVGSSTWSRSGVLASALVWGALGCGRTLSNPHPQEPAHPKPPEAENAPPAGEPGTIGGGVLEQPAVGPKPTDAAKVAGEPFVLVKNWDFGTTGTIRNVDDLITEFDFHDQFGTIANGTQYGAVIVAPTMATAIPVTPELGLPENVQPVEDPARPNREWTRDTLKAHVRPLSAGQASASTQAHDAGCGSFVAKWRLPTGGAKLQRDILWETRVRMPVPRPGFWFALWTAGNRWEQGAEMDVLEAFGAPHLVDAKVFHINSVGGKDRIDYANWFRGLEAAGVPSSNWDLRRFHIWTWVYKRDDTYEVYYDGKLAQHGTIHWTVGGAEGGPQIDMSFLFDFAWGHTKVGDVNVALPATSFPITYEIDYSRVYLR
ncbi:MAG: hypothetical protein ABW321_09275 [Polyangiales bacterium]